MRIDVIRVMRAGAQTPLPEADPAPSRDMTRFQVRKQLTPFVSTLLLFVVWQAACWAFRIPTFILPTPIESLTALVENWSGIWPNALHTLLTTLVGFGAAVVVGIVLGIAVGTSALVYDAINPLLIGFNAIPKVAVVPILVLWFGIGTVPAVITAFLTAFFPIVVNVATGMATVEPELSDVLRSLGASKIDIVRKVGIPRSLPYFFASLKIAIALAFRGRGGFRIDRVQRRDRLPHALGERYLPHPAGIRRAAGDRAHGHHHVSGGRPAGAALCLLGDARLRDRRLYGRRLMRSSGSNKRPTPSPFEERLG